MLDIEPVEDDDELSTIELLDELETLAIPEEELSFI
jgi:hypothetical protein